MKDTPTIDRANDPVVYKEQCSSVPYDENKGCRSWHWLPRAAAPKPSTAEPSLSAEMSELCAAIERLPASEQQTTLSIQAAALAARIRALDTGDR